MIGPDLAHSIRGTITNFQHDGNVIDSTWYVPLNTIGNVGVDETAVGTFLRRHLYRWQDDRHQ